MLMQHFLQLQLHIKATQVDFYLEVGLSQEMHCVHLSLAPLSFFRNASTEQRNVIFCIC